MDIADFISFILFVTFISSFLFLIITTNKKRKLLPGPNKLPIIGNLHQLGKLPHKTLKDLAKKHGDLMFLQLGSVPTLVVSSPDAAREIFRNHDLTFSGRPNLHAVKKLSYNNQNISFAPYGDYWREVRKILVLELMTMKRVQSFSKARAQEVAFMIEAIARSAARNDPVNLSSSAFSLSNNFVCHVALGLKSEVDGEKSRKFQKLLHVMQHLASEFNIGDYFPWLAWVNKINGTDRALEKSFRDMDEFFDVVIREHVDRRKGFKPEDEDDGDEHEDIVDVLLKVQKDPNQRIALTDEHLKGVLGDVFVAGTDTSAATIVWTMSELMRNPKTRQTAQHELRQLTTVRAGSLIQETDLSKLTYLKQVIKESFRLHPPAPLLIPRETTEKCTMLFDKDEYEIPEKTRVIFNASAIQRDERYYEDPEKFCPERFDNGKIDYRGQNFELLPFGSGRRICPGINFATPLVELALANLLYCFDWEFPEGVTGESLDMEEALGITMHKKTPLVLMARSRVNY